MEPLRPEERARLLQYGSTEEIDEYLDLLAQRFDTDPSKEPSETELSETNAREQRLEELARKFYPKAE